MTTRLLSLGGLLALALTNTQCQVLTLASSDMSSSHLISTGRTYRGLASWYSVSSNGRRTASGIPFSDHEATAAHRSLPFGTLVKVTNKRNGRSQVVRITDRGPYIRGRIIDVSKQVARDLDMVNSGVVPVEIEVLSPPNQA